MNAAAHPIRDDFPALSHDLDGQRIVYLDNAATTLKAKAVIDAISHHYSTNGANIHRGKHRLSEEASDAYEGSRVTVADYLGARASELVFVRNTTEALNVVAHGLRLERDDIVLGCLDAHHSQILPWRRAASLRVARVGRDGRVDLDHFRESLKARPRVVALTHCSNVTGVVHPVAEMIREVRDSCDALVVVDAAQSLPHEPIDVVELGADFVAFSPHKMLGPSGVGCLYGRAAQLEKLVPLVVGGGMVDWVDASDHVERRVPHRLEAGTPPIASVIGTAAAIRYLGGLDRAMRVGLDRELTQALVDGALARPYLRLIGPADIVDRHPIATLTLAGKASAGEVARLLSDSYGIMCRSGHLCAQPLVTQVAEGEVLRASAYLYNSAAEVERFYEALDELASWMGFGALAAAPLEAAGAR